MSAGKGMQLGKKSRTNNMFDQVRADLGPDEPDVSAPLISSTPAAHNTGKSSARTSMTGDREAVNVTISESISATISRGGSTESFEVGGKLELRISDASVTQIKLNLTTDDSRSAQWNTHPKVDKQVWQNSKVIQLKDTSRGFPSKGTALEVLRWKHAAKTGDGDLPLTLTAWVNESSDGTFSITVEYELSGNDTLRDVSVAIPFAASEPSVSSFDAVYEVSGDSLDWNIGTVDPDNGTGSFEFEAQADNESAFFPMRVAFSKSSPFVDVDVSLGIHASGASLLTLMQGLFGLTLEHERRHPLLQGCEVGRRQISTGVITQSQNELLGSSSICPHQLVSQLQSASWRSCLYHRMHGLVFMHSDTHCTMVSNMDRNTALLHNDALTWDRARIILRSEYLTTASGRLRTYVSVHSRASLTT